MQRLGLQIGSRYTLSIGELVALAQRAEALGYDSIWLGESWGRDAFTTLTALALHTRRIALGTNIVPVHARTPANLAMAAASLAEISGGRLRLGLGISGPGVVEHWHGVPFGRASRRLRETVDILRRALRGERVEVVGEEVTCRRFALAAPPARYPVPIYLGTIGPRNVRLTGEIADGWLPTWLPCSRIAEGLAELAEGARKAGRAVTDLEVALQVPLYVTEDLAAGRQAVRRLIAFYAGAMGDFHREHMSRRGYAAEAQAIYEAWQRKDHEAARRAVSETMLDDLAIVGPAEACRRRLAAYVEAGITLPLLSLTSMPQAQWLAAIEAMAPQGEAQG
ncbi:MAG: LLM class F420-dependent oxidoreductase [Candidatus Tectimicrobiota bacterium]|nr:MAG: LLM class F420-dependent oxidoreductase [Candidatus Tectomicrobia bacterium]